MKKRFTHIMQTAVGLLLLLFGAAAVLLLFWLALWLAYVNGATM